MTNPIYTQTEKIVDKRLKDGSLPKAYKFPAYNYFKPMFARLKPQEKDIPDFDYVFVPKGLTLSQWDTLLKKTCNGEWHSSVFPEDFNQGSGWELWLISGADKAELPNHISKQQAVDKKYVLAPLQAFLAQNWLRLEQGEEPVDENSWSICEDDIEVVGTLCSVFSYFDSVNRRAYSDPGDRGIADGSDVVRLSARGTDLVLDPAAEPLSSALPERLTINGEIYVKGVV